LATSTVLSVSISFVIVLMFDIAPSAVCNRS